MTTEFEERQRALANVTICASLFPAQRVHAENLRDCVAIPKAEYDMLQQALWILFQSHRYEPGVREILVQAGLLVPVRDAEDNHVVGTEWYSYPETPAAHEFAARMREKDGGDVD